MSPTLPTPDGPSASTTSTTPTVKLRDSCHACASSKLRCTKEKPICSRCAKRGKSCQYLVTRRAGRKQASKSISTETNPASAAPRPGSSTQSSSSAWKSSSQRDVTTSQPPAAAAAVVTAGSIHVLRDQYTNNNYDDFNSDLLATTSSCSSTVPTPGELIINFDEFLPSPRDVSIVDGSDVSNFPEYYFGQNCLPDLTMPWTQVLDKTGLNLGRDLRTLHASADLELLPSISSTQSPTRNYPPPSQPRPHHHQRPPQEDHEGQQQQQQQENQRHHQQQQESDSRPVINDPSCACVAQTLGLVSQLFQEPATSPATSPMCLSPGSSVSSHDRLATGSASASFADGEHAIETIRSMLQCPCQQDSYLLALMSLVVFKAVARYEDAARRSTENAETLAQTSLYGASTNGRRLIVDEDNPHPKLAVQTVLGKLHRVQGLVNAISQRLKTNKTGDMDTKAESSSVNERRDTLGCSSTDGSVPFSTTFLCQLEEDLRKQVRSVSSRLVNTLRQL